MRCFVELLLCVIIFWQLRQNIAAGYEYCKGKDYLCKGGSSNHIICNQSAVPSLGVVNGIVPMTAKLRNMLVDLQNKHRNKIACGEVKDEGGLLFPKATRMRTLLWDYELAYSAEVHAKQCNMEHDKCHNTEKFRHTGQNLFSAGSHKRRDSVLTEVEKGVNMWFAEHEKVKNGPEAAKNFPAEDLMNIGHFTVMANDRVARVGCAMTYCDNTGTVNKAPYTHFITCNYDFTNMVGRPIYSDGPSASKCGDWNASVSSDYKCLCKNNGKDYLKND